MQLFESNEAILLVLLEAEGLLENNNCTEPFKKYTKLFLVCLYKNLLHIMYVTRLKFAVLHTLRAPSSEGMSVCAIAFRRRHFSRFANDRRCDLAGGRIGCVLVVQKAKSCKWATIQIKSKILSASPLFYD